MVRRPTSSTGEIVNLASEVRQAHAHVIRRAQNAVGTGQYHTFRSGRARSGGGEVDVIGGVHQSVGTGGQKRAWGRR